MGSYNWEEVMWLPRGSFRQKLGLLNQDFDQAGALEMMNMADKDITDINEINREFKYVARDYVTGTPLSYIAGKVTWRNLLTEERGIMKGKGIDKASDMLASPVTCWDAVKMLWNARTAKGYNRMIKKGDSDGFFGVLSAQKAKDEKKYGSKFPEYWAVKSKFYDFLEDDVKNRMNLM